MKIPSYLQRNRYGIFHFRRAIPKHLQHVIGKTEIIRSLRTRQPREAVQLGRFIAIQVDQLFKEAEMGKKTYSKTEFIFELQLPDGTVNKTEITPHDIAAMKDAGLTSEQIKVLLNPGKRQR